MLSAEVHFLDLTTARPGAAVGRRAVDDGALVEDLVLGGDDEDTGTNDTVGGDAEGVVDAGAGADGGERFGQEVSGGRMKVMSSCPGPQRAFARDDKEG